MFSIFIHICSSYLFSYPFIHKKTIFTNPKDKNIQNINGFYGLIGPNINHTNIKSLYDLFIGDGIIQGVFIQNGNITFIKEFVKTDKLNMEKYIKIPDNMFFTFLKMILYEMKLLPNMLGVANTAFLNINKQTYTLFERDLPYEIKIDFDNKMVKTLQKINIPFLHTFSGHSKSIERGCIHGIETIDNDFFFKKINWFFLTDTFDLLKKITVPMKYLPIVHDFYSTENHFIIIDSPLKFDFYNIFKKQIPIFFDKYAKTYIYIIDKNTGEIDTYETDESFYLFHYSICEITDNSIIIRGSIYDSIDYNNIYHKGNYRKIIINRKTRKVNIEKNANLENANLDFPIKIEEKGSSNKIILRNIENNIVNGFVIVNDLQILKKIVFENIFICGEPAVTYVKETPYLLFYAFSTNKQYFIIMNLKTYELTKYDIFDKILVGFHSTFIQNDL